MIYLILYSSNDLAILPCERLFINNKNSDTSLYIERVYKEHTYTYRIGKDFNYYSYNFTDRF